MSAAPTNGDNFIANGLNAVTGGYLGQANAGTLARLAAGEDDRLSASDKNEVSFLTRPNLDVIFGAVDDYADLSQTGWGIVFAQADSIAEEKEARLAPLIEHRRAAAGERFRIYKGVDGYLPGESRQQFLARHDVSIFDGVDPDQMPYYLLLVAGPENIPFPFQYQLDIAFAVGRLHFDELSHYEMYARNVVAVEMGEWQPISRRGTFFSAVNNADLATNRSHLELMLPLQSEMNGYRGWQIDLQGKEEASKTNLHHLLHSQEPPSLLFTASHGIGFPAEHARQRQHQGALVCSDWPGPGSGPVTEDLYFSGDDIASDAALPGLIAFHFACYGAGTPAASDFDHMSHDSSTAFSGAPFLSQLPLRLLSLESGGALAIIGHIERTWATSFSWPGAASQLNAYRGLLRALMSGQPVGRAMEGMNQRYANVAASLSEQLQSYKKDLKFDAADPAASVQIARLWTMNNDARNLIVLGDPAARWTQLGEEV